MEESILEKMIGGRIDVERDRIAGTLRSAAR